MGAGQGSFSEAIGRVVLPPLLLPSWLREVAQRPIRPRRHEAARTISARFGAVNRKKDKFTQIQDVALGW
jgi:hypothetical protein